MTKHICGNCEKAFYPQNHIVNGRGAKYCSRKCYIAARWKGSGKCKACGKPCSLTYCNESCRLTYWFKNDYHTRRKVRQHEQKVAVMRALGGKCKECGIDDLRVLEINHVDTSRKTKHRTTHTIQRRLKDWKKQMDNLELLCANCHRIHTWVQRGYYDPNGIVAP